MKIPSASPERTEETSGFADRCFIPFSSCLSTPVLLLVGGAVTEAEAEVGERLIMRRRGLMKSLMTALKEAKGEFDPLQLSSKGLLFFFFLSIFRFNIQQHCTS